MVNAVSHYPSKQAKPPHNPQDYDWVHKLVFVLLFVCLFFPDEIDSFRINTFNYWQPGESYALCRPVRKYAKNMKICHEKI